jgi:hypothetical protein
VTGSLILNNLHLAMSRASPLLITSVEGSNFKYSQI